MYMHWTGAFSFPKEANVSSDHIISKKIWEGIGIAMQASHRAIPASFGRPSRDIYKYSKNYKSED